MDTQRYSVLLLKSQVTSLSLMKCTHTGKGNLPKTTHFCNPLLDELMFADNFT